jgi:hypothetical protein
MDDDNEQFARFDEMGEEAVRIHVHTFSFNTAHQRLAIKWLAKKDQELERRRDASQAEQIEIARSAKDAAWAAAMAAERAATAAEKANIRAIIALIIATISIIATVAGIWIVHRDVRKTIFLPSAYFSHARAFPADSLPPCSCRAYA